MHLRTANRWSVLLIGGLLAAACADDKTQAKTPQIEVSIDQMNFGNVAINTSKSKELVIAAASTIEVKILKLVVEPAGAFSLPADLPTVIAGDGVVKLQISFRPDAEQDFLAKIIVESDDPDPADAHREIALIGVGKSPNISIEPTAFTAANEITAIRCPDGKNYPRCTTRKTLRVLNSGEVELEIKSMEFLGTHPELSFLGSTSASAINAQGFANVGLEFHPKSTTPDEYDTTIRIVSNDPDTGTLDVPVHVKVIPNTPPTACVTTLKVQRGQYVGGNWEWSDDIGPGTLGYGDANEPVVRAGYLVWMYDGGTDASDGCATEDADGDDVIRKWTVTPLGGQPQPLVVGQEPGKPGADRMWFEVPALGDYEVKLEVWDTLHVSTPVADTLTVHAAPKDDLTVALDWRETATAFGSPTCNVTSGCVFDLDLHFIKMDTGVDPLTQRLWCYNDTWGYNRSPDWGTAGSIGNPSLNLDGRGVDERTRAENTTLELAEAGEYWVAVSYWKQENSNTDPKDVPHDRVKVYLYTASPSGPQRWPVDTLTFYQPGRDLYYPKAVQIGPDLVTQFDFWVVGKIVWPGLAAPRCSTGANPCVDFQPFPDSYLPEEFPLTEMTKSPPCTDRP